MVFSANRQRQTANGYGMVFSTNCQPPTANSKQQTEDGKLKTDAQSVNRETNN